MPYSVQKTVVSELPVVALFTVQTQGLQDNYVDNVALLYFSAEPLQPRATAARSAAVARSFNESIVSYRNLFSFTRIINKTVTITALQLQGFT